MRHLPWPWLLASECGKSSNELSRKEGKGQNCNKGCKFWGSPHPKGVKREVILGKWISHRFKRLFIAILTITVAVGQILSYTVNIQLFRNEKAFIYYGIRCIVSNLERYLVPCTFCHIFIQFIGPLFLKNSFMGVISVFQSCGS